MTLNFTETWGDPHYLGLTGLEVVAKDGEAVPLDIKQLDAQPRDLHILEGYETDDRTLDKSVVYIIMLLCPYYTALWHIIHKSILISAQVIDLCYP